MLNIFRKIIRTLYIRKLIRRGMKVGKNFHMEKGCSIDTPFAWLISFGDNVDIASGVYILAHDASTKQYLNYSKIGRVNIGNTVFIGAHTVILPNVTIGNDVIIAANSVVTKDIPDNCVVAGNPARIICNTSEYVEKNKRKMNSSAVYDVSWTIRGGVTAEKKKKMIDDLENGLGYID